MDPIGLTLENFDGIGAYRSQENGATIDVSGTLDGHDFVGAKGLGQALHDNPMTSYCVVEKMYRSGVGRNTVDAEQTYVVDLGKTFAANGYRVPDLMRTIAVGRTFYAVSAPAKEDSAVTARAETQQRNGDKQ
jgi:hypothetical protein